MRAHESARKRKASPPQKKTQHLALSDDGFDLTTAVADRFMAMNPPEEWASELEADDELAIRGRTVETPRVREMPEASRDQGQG